MSLKRNLIASRSHCWSSCVTNCLQMKMRMSCLKKTFCGDASSFAFLSAYPFSSCAEQVTACDSRSYQCWNDLGPEMSELVLLHLLRLPHHSRRSTACDYCTLILRLQSYHVARRSYSASDHMLLFAAVSVFFRYHQKHLFVNYPSIHSIKAVKTRLRVFQRQMAARWHCYTNGCSLSDSLLEASAACCLVKNRHLVSFGAA